MGRGDYHYRHEPIFYGWKPGAAHYFVDDRTQDSVWEIPRPKRSAEHPTMKPVELVARALRNSSRKGELVYEPFGGSGTTLIAAEQTGRVAAVIEKSPQYCDVIVKRWEELTGQKAALVRDGA
jgi:DNA modification methylase